MADYQITIDVDTPEEAEAVMSEIQAIVADIIENGGPAIKEYAESVIPKRSGKLAGGTSVTIEEGMLRVTNDVYYGPFVDQGHRTPSHFRGRPAKHVSLVPGRHFSEKIWQFVQDDINQRCRALLELR